MRVLLVEDEARIAGFLVKGLTARGYEVEHVLTGAEALARAGRTADGGFGLVFLDLGLPDMDGIDVVRRLRALGATIPVLVHTARGGERKAGLQAGADDVLVKPVPFGELLERVRAYAGRRHAA
jgi:DNA-binding response OmpR family regulator